MSDRSDVALDRARWRSVVVVYEVDGWKRGERG